MCVCVCTADFLSRFAQTGRPHGPIKTRRVGRVSAFLGEIPHFNNHYYLSLFNVTTAVTKIASGLTSTTARLSRLTRGITVSQYLQKPLFDPVALWLLLEKAGVILVHAGLLSVNKINFSSVKEDINLVLKPRSIPSDNLHRSLSVGFLCALSEVILNYFTRTSLKRRAKFCYRKATCSNSAFIRRLWRASTKHRAKSHFR